MAAIFMLGMFIGSYMCGIVSDKKGRMFPFKKTMMIIVLSLVFLIFSVNFYMISIAFLVYGFATGGEITMGGIVFQEFCPPSKQHWLVGLSITWCLGAVITALVVSFFMAIDFPIILWRAVCIFNIVYALIVFVLRLKLPETPRYLINNGREKEAQEVLEMVCRVNDKSIEISSEMLKERSKTYDEYSYSLIEEEGGNATFGGLWKIEYLKTTLIFTFSFLCGNLSFTFLGFFMPELLSDAGVEGVYIYLTIAVQQSAGIPGILLGTYLVETKLGRKYSIVFPMVVSSVVNLIFVAVRVYWEILLCTSFTYLSTYLAWSSLYTISPESYKTNLRNTGVGWANACAKLGGIIGPLLGGAILGIENGFYICIAMASIMTTIVAILILFIKETRGKSLD